MVIQAFDLQGKRVIVTGGGSGIGAAITELFASVGATVVVGDINIDVAQAQHADSPHADQIQIVECDISNPEQVATLVTASLKQGNIDVLVNNAGIGFVGTIETTSMADFDHLYNTNVKGTFNMTKALLPHFKKQGKGVIVNMASICGMVGVPDRFAYCMTKFAIVGMTKSMALDHAKDNIRVNCICPGRIATPFMVQRINEYPDPDAIRADMDASQPLGRMGEPEEVATVALYLASDASAFVTGACESVDGGWLAG